jgi:hypothetical protein
MRNPSAVHSRKGSEKYETSNSSRGFFWRYVKKKKKWWWYLLQQQQLQAPAPTLADTATSSFLFCWNDQSSRDCSFLPSLISSFLLLLFLLLHSDSRLHGFTEFA